MTTSTRLAVLSVLVAIGAVATYVLLLGVAMVRNHPEGYVIAFAAATALAVLAVARARTRRWPAWVALGVTSLLLIAGAWFNFVARGCPIRRRRSRWARRHRTSPCPMRRAGPSRSRTIAGRSRWCSSSTAAIGDRSACPSSKVLEPSFRRPSRPASRSSPSRPIPMSGASSSPRACASAIGSSPTAISRWRGAMGSSTRAGDRRARTCRARPRWCWTAGGRALVLGQPQLPGAARSRRRAPRGAFPRGGKGLESPHEDPHRGRGVRRIRPRRRRWASWWRRSTSWGSTRCGSRKC